MGIVGWYRPFDEFLHLLLLPASLRYLTFNNLPPLNLEGGQAKKKF